MLKALPAIHRATLSRLEGNGCLFTALRANRFGLDAVNTSRAVAALRAGRFARLATFRFVLKTLVGEKHLLAGRENKLRPTIGTLQDPIVIFHTLLRTRTGREQAAVPSKQVTRATGLNKIRRSAVLDDVAWKVQS